MLKNFVYLHVDLWSYYKQNLSFVLTDHDFIKFVATRLINLICRPAHFKLIIYFVITHLAVWGN